MIIRLNALSVTYITRGFCLVRAGRKLVRPLATSAAACVVAGTAVASVAFMDALYEPGQAIGEGVKGDIWKAKHKRTKVLELDGGPTSLLLTYIRDADTQGKQFVIFADILLQLLVTYAALELSSDKEVVTTSAGVQFMGTKLREKKILAVYVSGPECHAEQCFCQAFDCLPDVQTCEIVVKDGKLLSHTVPQHASKDFSHVVMLSPTIGNGLSEVACVNLLKAKQFAEDTIILTSILTSLSGINKFNKECTGVRVVVGAVDPLLRSDNEIVPGVGNFAGRYMEGINVLKPPDASLGKTGPAGSAGLTDKKSWMGWVVRFVWPR